jgi:hypothetical protein
VSELATRQHTSRSAEGPSCTRCAERESAINLLEMTKILLVGRIGPDKSTSGAIAVVSARSRQRGQDRVLRAHQQLTRCRLLSTADVLDSCARGFTGPQSAGPLRKDMLARSCKVEGG